MNDRLERITSCDDVIRRLRPMDMMSLEAHCSRLQPMDALYLLGALAEPLVVKRYLAGIDLGRDIVLATLDCAGAVTSTVRVRTSSGSPWAELLPAREHHRVTAEAWNGIVGAAVEAAKDAGIGWLLAVIPGHDKFTFDALRAAGFELGADEEGIVGELCLTTTAGGFRDG